MKIPSIIRIPQHKKFNFEPRYYDPVKEDINNRTALIEQEMRQTTHSFQRSNISGSFARRAKQTRDTNFLQFFIVVALMALFSGYLYLGNAVFYVFWLFVPIYLYYRFKKYLKRS